MKVELLNNWDVREAQEFYRKQGYSASIGKDDIVLVTKNNDAIIGIVRISNEKQIEILRGMFIDKPWQGKGIGKKMLRELEQFFQKEESYCIPYSHLEQFYATIGFRNIAPHESPTILQNRLLNYTQKSLNCIIMKRHNTYNRGVV